MNLLFVDTETAGIPLDTSASYRNVDNWPAIKQIAWIVYRKDGVVCIQRNFAISDDVDSAPTNSSDYISKTIKPIHVILHDFLNDLQSCDVIIGHNIQYDVTVILCEMYRLGLDTERLENLQQFCTMKYGVKACGFDTKYGDRYPSLQELYTKLFHQPFENAHDAYCDITATADCFWEFVRRDNLQCEDYPYLMPDSQRLDLANKYAEEADAIQKPVPLPMDRNQEKAEIMMLFTYLRERERKVFAGQSTDKLDAKFRREYESRYGAIDRLPTSLLNIKTSSRRAYEAKLKQVYRTQASLHEKAASLGYPYSMYRLGHLYYYHLDNNNTAIDWYNKAIKNGYVSPDCYFEFATLSARLYGDKSINAPVFYTKWAQMCESSLETISRENLDLLIKAYEEGKYGQKQNNQRAIELCKQALFHNRPDFGRTDYRRGIRYELASLLEKSGDYTGAVEQYEIYLQELRDLGKYSLDCYTIEERLLKYYFEGTVIPVDYQKAKHYIDILVSKSSPIGYYYLGLCYENGLADSQTDIYKAFQCYEKASEQVPDALKRIGIMYLNGIGCEKSKKKAREYLEKAQSEGLDVSPYLEKAKKWF